MKRCGFLVTALGALVLCSTACADPVQLVMGTGGTTGTYYPLGGAISQIVSDHSDGAVTISAQATGASNENINLLKNGDVDLAIVQNDIAFYAKTGSMFFKEPVKNIRAISRLWPEPIQVAVNKDCPANSIADFGKLRISIGAPGSGNEANARQIFGAYGFYEEKDGKGEYKGFEPFFLSYAETTSHFKDRQIDGFEFTTAAPNSGIQEIVTTQPLKFINIDGAKRDEIIKAYPFFAPSVIPADTYQNQPKPVDTIAVQACLFCRSDLPDDLVYTITKTMFSQLALIGEAHHKSKEIVLEKALDGLQVEDLHPGALKYYKEVGLIK